MSSNFSFEKTRNEFVNVISEDITSRKLDTVLGFTSLYKSVAGSDVDKRTATDQSLRDLVSKHIKEIIESSDQRKLVNSCLDVIAAAVTIAKNSYCSASVPFILLGDLLDCLTLDACDPVFCFIEERVSTWKSPQFYTAGKNYLLRMCNDLLRRLSQAQNNIFCGRIQLFLARLFPLSEKSALNLVSQFNVDNVTLFSDDEQKGKSPNEKVDRSGGDELWLDSSVEAIEEMEVDSKTKEEEKKSAGFVDKELYKNIWSLQDFFRNPTQCYQEEGWKKMTHKMGEIFRVFSSYKLDEGGRTNSISSKNKAYFAKYLTSKKLIDLQLNDTMFRRQLLTQVIILCQYLKGTVKFKSATMTLSSAQKDWASSTMDTSYKLLEETPPNGKHFAKYIKNILTREEFWIEWKNEGCPSFIKTNSKEAEDLTSPPAKKKKLTDNVPLFKPKKKSTIANDFISGKPLGLGSPELTRLWGLCEDNMAACKAKERCFLPEKAEFFADSIEFMDPQNMVEEQYQPYNDINFQWKALRLLSQKSSLFFQSQPSNMQFKSVPQYLKGVIEKLGEEITPVEEVINVKEEGELSGAQSKVDEDQDDETNVAEDEEDGNESDDVLDEDDEENETMNDDSQQEDIDSAEEDALLVDSVAPDNNLSSDSVTTIARKLGADWKILAPHLTLKPSDIREIQEDSEDIILQARQALVTWQDRNRGQSLAKEVLNEAFTKAGLKME